MPDIHAWVELLPGGTDERPFPPRTRTFDSFYSQKQKTLRFEADVFDCEVLGEVPPEIRGALFRVGPDRAYPPLEGDVIINGDGVVSAFYFENGNVDFRCRYVKTERYLAERAAWRRLYGKYRNQHTDEATTAGTNRDNTANTYGFFHHGKLFALREDSQPSYRPIATRNPRR